MSFRTIHRLAAVGALVMLLGCAAPAPHEHPEEPGPPSEHGHHDMGMMKGPMAVATLTPLQGQNVQGWVMFHQHGDHLMVHAHLSGLKPGSEQGFHVHEKGDCASPDGSSAGGHFNPDQQPHGPQTGPHHAGDMPSLKVDAQGQADAHFALEGASLAAGQPGSIVGRSVVVHANPDDYTSQPAGNAGPRVACGVIAALSHPMMH